MRVPQKLENPTMDVGMHCWSKWISIGSGIPTYSH